MTTSELLQRIARAKRRIRDCNIENCWRCANEKADILRWTAEIKRIEHLYELIDGPPQAD